MLFREAAEYFDKIEKASSRLVMTDILAELFEKMPADDSKRIVYLLQGRIAPQFEGKEIGFGEKLISEGIAKATGFLREEVDKKFNKIGDLGSVAEEYLNNKKQQSLSIQALSVEKVFYNLKKMSQTEGTGSQELKIKLLAELFNSASPTEGRYIARIPLGNIRLGIGDPTIMDAFAMMLTKKEQETLQKEKKKGMKKKDEKEIEDKQRKLKVGIRERIEATYNIFSDLGDIAEILKTKGLIGLEEIHIAPGTPIRPTAAERLPSAAEIIEKLGTCAVESKYDGFRCITGFAPIYVKNKGLLSIKDCKIGDFALTHKGEFKKILALNKRKLDKGEKLFKIQTYLGNGFKITEKHPLLVWKNNRKTWVPVEQIKKDDLLVFPLPKNNLFSEKPPKKLNLYTIDNYHKHIQLTNEFFRFIGYWIGDGYTNDFHNTERIGLIFNYKTEQALCKYYEKLIKKLFNVTTSKNIHAGAIYLYWRDAPFKKWLTQNFRRDWVGKMLPNWFYNIKKEEFGQFLLGWIESDGTTDKIGRTAITTKERDLAMFAQLLALKFHTIIGVKKIKVKLPKFIGNYYKLVVTKNERKAAFKNDFLAVKIHTLEKIKYPQRTKTNVYNIQIEGDESYCSTMLTLHNCQISKDNEKIRIFSRQSEEITNMFPEIIEAVKTQIIPKKCIVEGEALAFNEETQEYYPFQVTIQRKRKYEIEKKAKEYPLNLFLFDVMYSDGESYMEKPFIERRKKLASMIKEGGLIRLSEQKIISKAEDLEAFFEEKISQGLEGIMAKDLNAPYLAGARKFAWIKLKRSYKGSLDDTLDLVIIGYYAGKGKRTQFGLGALLVATYNEKNDEFESVAKIGTGMTEEILAELEGLLSKISTKTKPARVTSELEVDHWVTPKYVIEVRADEITHSPMHSCGKEKGKGYALRFPRMIKIRSEKKPEDATTTEEVKQMFNIQKRVAIENPMDK
ncbi:MAG: ATP-dependent DNA ligase [archaeon]